MGKDWQLRPESPFKQEPKIERWPKFPSPKNEKYGKKDLWFTRTSICSEELNMVFSGSLKDDVPDDDYDVGGRHDEPVERAFKIPKVPI